MSDEFEITQLIKENEQLKQKIADLEKSKRIFAENALKESHKVLEEQKIILDQVLSATPDHFIMYDWQGKHIFVNKNGLEAQSLRNEDVIGKTWREIGFPEEQGLMFDEYLKRVFEYGETITFESFFPSKDGLKFWESIYTPLFDNTGNVLYMVSTYRDITDRKKAEKELRNAEENLKRTENFSLVMATHVSLDGTWLKVPPSLCQLLGYTSEELLSGKFKDVTHPDDFETDWSQCQRLISGEIKSFDLEKRYICKDGKIIWVYLNCSIVADEKGNPLHFLTYIKDITEKKQNEDNIRASLKEKEILLREIHHRVKNNLQIVLSLLSLQANVVSDKQIIDALKESQNRIKSMSLVHEKLYQSKNFSNIDFAKYTESLVYNIFRSYGKLASAIRYNSDISVNSFDIDSTITCGLIINELVSNSIKYAFPLDVFFDKNKEKIISISFKKNQENKLVLSVMDNGTGYPDNIDFENSGTLGLQLVKLLVTQLDGTLGFDNKNGTSISITF